MAATNINRVVLTGNLTRDPELRSTPSGTSVCSLRVACNTRRKDASGEWVDKPNYFDVTVWGAQGENCAQYLSKGRPVAVDGRLEWREWQDKEGEQAPVGRHHRRLRAVPRLARQRGRRQRLALHAPERRAGGHRRLPDRAHRWRRRRRKPGRRHPVLSYAGWRSLTVRTSSRRAAAAWATR